MPLSPSHNAMRRRKEQNVIYQLRARQRDNQWNVRRNLSIVRDLVCQETSSFTKVWEKVSRSPIAYEGNRIYFENYRSVFVGHGLNGEPELLYKLPHSPLKHKIEDAVICQFQLSNLPMKNKGYKGHLLALTRDNWLVRHDMNTGQVLEEVFLSERYKFRHLGWQSEGGTIVLRTIHTRLSAMARAAGIIQTLLMGLAVFSIFPLRLVAVMEVQKEIFGKDISDSTISQDLLIIMHQGGNVRLYNFDSIVQENTIVHAQLGEMCSEVNGIVGNHPTGIPCTVKLKETPPVLFQVRCQDHYLQMGGFPWHYVFTPLRNNGVFHVYRVDNQKQADNGIIDIDTLSIEPDKVVFHSDESGRILHISGNTLRVMKLQSDNSTTSEVKECFTISPRSPEGKEPSSPSFTGGEDNSWTLSSSGRIIKRRLFDGSVRPTMECIKEVDYENELDLLVVTSVTDSNDETSASVCLHDNQTGTLLKQIPLEESWDETMEHTISFDLDSFVHIFKSAASKFHCALYRLDRTSEDNNSMEPQNNKHNKQNTRCSRQSRRASVWRRLQDTSDDDR